MSGITTLMMRGRVPGAPAPSPAPSPAPAPGVQGVANNQVWEAQSDPIDPGHAFQGTVQASFEPNGVINTQVLDSPLQFQWFSPNDSIFGQTKFIRFDQSNGTLHSNLAPEGVWLQMNQSRVVGRGYGAQRGQSTTWLVRIASDPNGINILGTNTLRLTVPVA